MCGMGGKRGKDTQDEQVAMVGDVDIEGEGCVEGSEDAKRPEPVTPKGPLFDIRENGGVKQTERRWYCAVQLQGGVLRCEVGDRER